MEKTKLALHEASENLEKRISTLNQAVHTSSCLADAQDLPSSYAGTWTCEAQLRANELLLQLMCCSQPFSNLDAQSCVSGNDNDETWLT